MLAVRASIVAELIVATSASVLLATAQPPRHPFAMPELPKIVHADPATPCWQLPPDAAKAYVAHRFELAESLLSAACGRDDGPLLLELDRLWRRATTGSVDDRYYALIDALAIDTTFGGLLADEIDQQERAIVEQVALQLVAQHRYDTAETAIEHGKLLGVDMSRAERARR